MKLQLSDRSWSQLYVPHPLACTPISKNANHSHCGSMEVCMHVHFPAGTALHLYFPSMPYILYFHKVYFSNKKQLLSIKIPLLNYIQALVQNLLYHIQHDFFFFYCSHLAINIRIVYRTFFKKAKLLFSTFYIHTLCASFQSIQCTSVKSLA